MPKDYVGKRVNKLLVPGDPGYNNPNTPWGWMRNVSGWQKPDAIRIEISGFFLIDRRMKPSIAIFKNRIIVGDDPGRFGDEPVPFASLNEALHHKKQMNLSMADELLVKPVALAPDPGMGNAKPNIMWVDQKTARNM